MHNPERLPLLINIGLIACQARFYSELDGYRSIMPADSHEDQWISQTSDLWFEATSAVIQLAEMDHRNDFTPKQNPMLSAFGLLEEYWHARGRLDPDPEDHDEY